jgi:hypothetical protein
VSYAAQYCGKVTHASKDIAEGHLLLLRHAGKSRERETGRPLHVYYCEVCAGYHVGHDRRADEAA